MLVCVYMCVCLSACAQHMYKWVHTVRFHFEDSFTCLFRAEIILKMTSLTMGL